MNGHPCSSLSMKGHSNLITFSRISCVQLILQYVFNTVLTTVSCRPAPWQQRLYSPSGDCYGGPVVVGVRINLTLKRCSPGRLRATGNSKISSSGIYTSYILKGAVIMVKPSRLNSRFVIDFRRTKGSPMLPSTK